VSLDRPYLALCAIFRDEAPYLAEWLAFHRLVGVDHFFLYDNGSADRPEDVLRPFLTEGCVTLRPWPVPFHEHAARRAYADCLEQVRGRVRWLACLDVDEFLFAPRQRSLARPSAATRRSRAWSCAGRCTGRAAWRAAPRRRSSPASSAGPRRPGSATGASSRSWTRSARSSR